MKHKPPMSVPPRILLLEDRMVIMLQAEDVLRSGGYSVITAATTMAALGVLGAGVVDVAVLNIDLGGGEMSFSVADELMRRRIPFLFTSGHSASIVPARFEAVQLVSKPYLPSELLAGVTVLMLDME